MILIYKRLSHSPNGWTDGELAVKWITDDFDRLTKDKAGSHTRVLLLDGHSSHYTLGLLTFAKDHNIVLLRYPPHCTHALQGLDVVCFAKMKEAWKRAIMSFEARTQQSVKKKDFTEVFGQAFLEAFTKETVEAAFKATGIFPFNPNAITAQQMKPSETTSTVAGFGMEQPSPVRAILSVFPFSFRAASQNPDDVEANIPGSPTLSEQIHECSTALRQTSSGSILASTDTWTTANHIPPLVLHNSHRTAPQPDWSPLKRDVSTLQSQELMEEHIRKLTDALQTAKQNIAIRNDHERAQNAQLVIQNMVLQKMNQSFHAAESRKKKKQATIYLEGKGRHLTNEAFIEEVQQAAVDRAEREREKEKRKEGRRRTSDMNARVDEVWKQRQEEQKAAMKEWEALCEKLIAEGVRKKNLPLKPVRMLKKDVIDQVRKFAVLPEDGEGLEEGDESVDESSDDGEDES